MGRMTASMPFAIVMVKQLRFQFAAGGFAGNKKRASEDALFV
jgi:hypothetical protein